MSQLEYQFTLFKILIYAIYAYFTSMLQMFLLQVDSVQAVHVFQKIRLLQTNYG